MADYTASYNGLAFGAGTNLELLSIQGLEDLPAIAGRDETRSEDTGMFAGRDLARHRDVLVELLVLASPGTTFAAAVAALQAATVPGGSTELPLSFTLPGRATRRINVRPRRRVLPVDADYQYGYGKAVVQFTATDPRIYDDTLSSATVALPAAASGATFPVTFNLGFGGITGAGGQINAANAGTFATRPTATITGPAINPRIENRTAGQTVKFNITLAAGDSLVVNFDAHSVVLNGTASRRSTLTTDSRWWELAANTTSEIHYLSDDASPTGSQLTLTWRSAWI